VVVSSALLALLTPRPDLFEYVLISFIVLWILFVCVVETARSSADAVLSMCFGSLRKRTSKQIAKSKGERGQPCLTPLLMLSLACGLLLN